MSGKLPAQPWTYTGTSEEELIDGYGETIAYVYNDTLAEVIQGIPTLIAALETARHALTTLHGLTATDELILPSLERWKIDESKALAEIDAALLVARGAP